MTRAAPNSPGPVAPKRTPFVLLVATLLIGGLTGLLALNTISAADEVKQQQIADSTALTAARVQQLNVDIAAAAAPAALAGAATRLGLVPAANPAFLQIRPDGSVLLLGTPAVVSAPPIPLGLPPVGSTALVPSVTTPAAAPTTPAAAPTTPAAAPTTPAAAPTTPAAAPTTPAAAPTTPAAAPTTPAAATPVATVSLPGGSR